MPRGSKPRYKKEYCQKLIDYMSEGLSFDSFGAEVKVSRVTLYNWIEKYPEFQDAKSEGEMRSLQWWEKIGRSGMVGKIKGFNPAIYIFSMKSRFAKYGWRDIPEDITIIREPSRADVRRQLEDFKAMIRDTACQSMTPSSPERLVAPSQSGLLGASCKPESTP